MVLQAKGQPLQQGQVQLDPLREGRKGSKRVLCLDWHNVFQIKEGWKDVVPGRHINKIWDLQAEQWEIHLISFCGQKRAQEVEDWARSLPIKWASVRCIRERCGPWGKAAWAKYLGCSVVMDDNRHILEEALQEGMDVLPVTTWHEKHLWYWGKPFDSFPEAVDHLLMMDAALATRATAHTPCNKGGPEQQVLVRRTKQAPSPCDKDQTSPKPL